MISSACTLTRVSSLLKVLNLSAVKEVTVSVGSFVKDSYVATGEATAFRLTFLLVAGFLYRTQILGT